jgi:hypothetical protein
MLALQLNPMISVMSIGTLVIAPAFDFMGIGFPRLGTNAFSYASCDLIDLGPAVPDCSCRADGAWHAGGPYL